MTTRFLFASVAILAGVGRMSPHQAPSPSTKGAREVVALINTAPASAIRAYVDSAFAGRMRSLPIQAHLNFFLGQREQSGGFEWVEVQEETAGRTTALLKGKLTGELIAPMVQTEATAPYRVAGIGQRPPRTTAAASEPRVASDAEMAKVLEQYVTTLAKADVFSGAVLLAKDGKTLYAGAF